MRDDVLESGHEEAPGAQVARGCQVAVNGMEIPQCGVRGVVEPLPFALGKKIRYQSVTNVVAEGAEDIACFDLATRGKGEAFEADHGVAAPVGEPVVAGDNGAHLIA